MNGSKIIAIASIVLLGMLTIYQHSGLSARPQDATFKGMLLGFSFLAAGLATWLIALSKAFNAGQRGWLIAIFFFWPCMYFYLFKYSNPASRGA